MKIKSITIKRFRSIMNLNLNIDELSYLITICGANNSGKTNVLRALEIFFKPHKYNAYVDAPNHKFYGSRGQSVYPEIIVHFVESENDYIIKREFDLNGVKAVSGKLNKEPIKEERITALLNKIAFFYLPAINVNFPELVNDLIEEIYDLEYEKARFTGLKGELKKAFEDYTKGTIEVLNNLATDINPVFKEFNENWEVGFEFSSDVKKFRDLISNDIEFYFNDKTNRNIDSKGSGLQRLGYILMHSKLIDKIKNKFIILLIDEPDIYLHDGLQIKLKNHLVDLAKKAQIIITTHSKTFIDSYQLRNTFLLDIKIDEATHYKRAGKDFYPVNTILIDIEEANGNKKIKEYLGIESDDYELLQAYNIIVEGNCDKKYIEEFGKFYSFEIPNIISANGVTNIEKYLEFYNAFYFDKPGKPIILVLYDNDAAGRDVFNHITKKITSDHFKNLNIKQDFTPNYLGEKPEISKVKNNQVHQNFEIEDFIFPELTAKLCNNILVKKGMAQINTRSLLTKLKSNSYKNKGILYVVEILKNDSNLEDGHTINFDTPNMKKSLAESFNIEGNRTLIKSIKEYDLKYPKFKENLMQILNNGA
ncbi:ATP-dependent nuclease [Kaistella carnis]|uniref:ATP-dependent nuclease n=1 Tax=Kaistella carnis TaxID=1241979 RepID=UPI00289A637F|nr:AAA family ATPase [Kaistella carnis]